MPSNDGLTVYIVFMTRDDFSRSVIRRLAESAGQRCSAPACRAQTVGPSATRKGAISQNGEASHIAGAAKNGPRYDPQMSPQERASYENGIWLCATHAKMIDDDSKRFTKQLLKSWKARAEAEAGKALGRPLYFDSRRLARHSIRIAAREDLWPALHGFVWDIGLHSWGEECASIVTNCTYEIALNHLIHNSRSSPVDVKADDWGISIVAAGPKFGIAELIAAANGRGGQASLVALRKHYSGLLQASYSYSPWENEWNIRNILIDGNAGPCAVDVRDLNEGNAQPYPERLARCDEIQIYVSDTFSFSNASLILKEIIRLAPDKPIIIHGLANEPGLRAYILRIAPQCRFSA